MGPYFFESLSERGLFDLRRVRGGREVADVQPLWPRPVRLFVCSSVCQRVFSPLPRDARSCHGWGARKGFEASLFPGISWKVAKVKLLTFSLSSSSPNWREEEKTKKRWFFFAIQALSLSFSPAHALSLFSLICLQKWTSFFGERKHDMNWTLFSSLSFSAVFTLSM